MYYYNVSYSKKQHLPRHFSLCTNTSCKIHEVSFRFDILTLLCNVIKVSQFLWFHCISSTVYLLKATVYQVRPPSSISLFEWQRTSYAFKKNTIEKKLPRYMYLNNLYDFLSNDSILNSPIENYSFKAHLRLPMSTETNTLTKGGLYVAVIITCCIFIYFLTKSRTSCLEFMQRKCLSFYQRPSLWEMFVTWTKRPRK